ncbi:predicted protein, partial [Arabidopsis lyrata subsp. lyrata]
MAAVQAFTPLADIKPFKTHWKIQVKIVHSWTQYTQFTGETVEMVLADTSDNLIHATVKKPQVSKLQRAVSNSFDMSLLEINPNYLAVLEFVANLPPDVMPLTIEDSKAKQVNAEQRKKDYYDRFPRKTISGLFCFSETGKCNIICTIMNIDTDYSWYFFSCLKCSKTAYKIPKVENEIVKKGKKEMFWCPTCKEDTPKVIPRYLLNVGVMDSTGDTKCLIFDKSAQEIIGVSAEDLLEGKWDE